MTTLPHNVWEEPRAYNIHAAIPEGCERKGLTLKITAAELGRLFITHLLYHKNILSSHSASKEGHAF